MTVAVCSTLYELTQQRGTAWSSRIHRLIWQLPYIGHVITIVNLVTVVVMTTVPVTLDDCHPNGWLISLYFIYINSQ